MFAQLFHSRRSVIRTRPFLLFACLLLGLSFVPVLRSGAARLVAKVVPAAEQRVPGTPTAKGLAGFPVSPFFVPGITATKTGVLGTAPGDDVNGNGKINRGDNLLYTVIINNSGTDATGVNFSDTIDANTTLVAGSFSASAVATDDTFPVAVTGNVSINSANLSSPFSVVTNDYLGATPTATISAFDATSTNGGNVTMTTSGADIGKFTYDPPAGYEGTDTFTYTLTDNANASSAIAHRKATVTITVSGMIWFINNAASPCIAATCGRLSNPFSTLAAFQGFNDGAGNHPANNDNIFIYESATSYTGGVILRTGQKLIGQDATSSLSTITGLTPVTGSAALPAMNTGAPATTIVNAAAIGVQLGSGNRLEGFTCGTAATAMTGISGNAFGTVTINNVIINTNGPALSLNTGAVAGSGFSSITASSGINGIALTSVTGTLTVSAGSLSGHSGAAFNVAGGTCSITYSGGITQGNNAALVSIGGHSTGTITFNTGTLSATNGTGISLDNADGTYNFSGTTTLNGGDAGIDITNGSAGTISFGSSTTITNPSGLALNVDGTSAAITGGITVAGSISKNNDGKLVDFFNYDTGTATISATLSCTSTCDGVEVTNNGSAGTLNFTGAATLNTGASMAVNLDTNTGGTITFNGGLDIDTTSGSGFRAVGGGTVNVCDESPCNPAATGALSNTIASATGTALIVTSTTIGANNLEFRSISANGATVGINLDTTGPNGLKVTGTGTAGTGGTIQSSVQRGARFSSASNISLSWMNFTGNGTANLTAANVCGEAYNGTNTNCAAGIDMQSATNVSLTGVKVSGGAQLGINGRGVNGLSMNTVEVNNNGNENLEDGIQLVNLTGTMTWTDLNIHDNFHRQVEVQTATGTNNVTINKTAGGTLFFGNATFGPTTNSSGILFSGHGTANITAVVQGATFARNYGSAFFSDIADSATAYVEVNGGQMIDNGLLLEGGGIGTGNMTYKLKNLTTAYADPAHTNSSLIGFLKGGGASGTFNGEISGNQIGNAAILGSGGPCPGCTTMLITNAGTSGVHNVLISGNTFRRSQDGVINVTSGIGTFNDTGQMNVRIVNNTITDPDGSSDLPITVVNGTDPGDTTKTCADIVSNNISDPGGGGTWNATAFIRLRHVQNNQVFRLPGYTGGPTDITAVQNFLNGQNTLTGGASSVTLGAGPGTFGNSSPAGTPCFTPVARQVDEAEVGSASGSGCDLANAWIHAPHEFIEAKNNNEASPASNSPRNAGDHPRLLAKASFELLRRGNSSIYPPLNTNMASTTAQENSTEVQTIFRSEDPPVRTASVGSTPHLAGVISDLRWTVAQGIAALEPTVFAQRANYNPLVSSDDVKRPGSGETVSAAIGTLPAGKSVTITFKATLSLSLGYNSVSNQGTVSGSNFANVLTDDPGVVGAANPTVNVISAADLTAVKTNNASGTRPINTAWNWTIAVSNGGTEDAVFTSGQLVFTDSLPDTNITYGSPTTNNANVSCTIDGSFNLTCLAGASGLTLAGPGGTFNITVPVTGASVAGSYANPRAGGSGCAVDPSSLIDEGANEGNNTCANTVNVFTPPTVVKSFTPTAVAPGGISTLSIQITNPVGNPAPLTGIAFTDTFPAGLQVAASPMATNSCSGALTPAPAGGNTSITLAASSLNAGASCTVTVKVTPTTGGAKVNNVTVASTEGGNATVASATLTVGKAPLDFDGDGTSDYAVVRDSGAPRLSGLDAGTLDLPDNQVPDPDPNATAPNPHRGYYFRLPGVRFDPLSPSLGRADTALANLLRWSINTSGSGADITKDFGTLADFPVPADYDGDGICDIAVWTGGVGAKFRVLTSASNFTTFVEYTLGNATSDPSVVGDYDGDGRADPAILNATTGQWSYLGGATHATLVTVTPIGTFGGGFPIPGDYDGDGKYDFMLETRDGVNPTMGHFYQWNNTGSTTPPATANFAFGNYRDVVIPGDYDGDGKTDICVASLIVNPVAWRIRLTNGGTLLGPFTLGNPLMDYTISGDYNGDQKAELTIFHPPATTQFQSLLAPNFLTPTTNANWGLPNDYPLAYFNSH